MGARFHRRPRRIHFYFFSPGTFIRRNSTLTCKLNTQHSGIPHPHPRDSHINITSARRSNAHTQLPVYQHKQVRTGREGGGGEERHAEKSEGTHSCPHGREVFRGLLYARARHGLFPKHVPASEIHPVNHARMYETEQRHWRRRGYHREKDDDVVYLGRAAAVGTCGVHTGRSRRSVNCNLEQNRKLCARSVVTDERVERLRSSVCKCGDR